MKNIICLIVALSLSLPVFAWAIHDDTETTNCLDCHISLPFERADLSYTDEAGETCQKCHSDFPCSTSKDEGSFAHPMDVIPSMSIPLDMPLSQSGMITCITCHSYHVEFWNSEYNNKFLLRRSKGAPLCYTCHKDF